MKRLAELERIRSALCAGLVLLGLSVIAGWFYGVEPLKSVLPDHSTMKFNAAVGFVLVGAGLWLAGRPQRLARGAAAVTGLALGALGALTLAEYVLGRDLGIDQLVVADTGTLTGSGFPGRMSPLTATSWVALGLSIGLLALGPTRPVRRIGHLVSTVAGFVAFFAAAGYAFGAHAFFNFAYYALTAVHTAVGLLACTTVALMTRPLEGWLGGLGDAPAARTTLREFLPLAIVLPVGVGLVLLSGTGAGAYDSAFAFAIFVPVMTAALIWLGFRTAARARAAEVALTASETTAREQLEELEAIYESSPVGLAFLTPDLRFVRVNRRLAEMNGVPAAAHVGRTIEEVVPDIAEQVRAILARLEAGEPIISYEIGGETPSRPGVKCWWLEYWLPLRHEDGRLRGLNVVVEDITERKLAELHRKLLVDELNHRVRNTLAVVQSIARQTFASEAAAGPAREAFEARLYALAGAHAILTRENWEAADLNEIVAAAAGAAYAGRLHLEGPPISLRPALGVSLSLALHELSTNAAKYGALSVPTGRVRVSWRLVGEQAERLALRWEEEGGPPVTAPARRGFGTRMLERALSAELQGVVRLEFAPCGVICDMEARLEGRPSLRLVGEPRIEAHA